MLPDATGRAPLQVSARLADERLPGDGSNRHATANSDGTFTLEGLFGRRTIAVSNVPSGWYVKAIRYGSRDVIDEPVEFKPDSDAPLEIVLSNRGASVTGTVADVIDHRVARAQVWLFRAPVNKDGAPRLAGSVLTVTGNYSFGPLRDGDYLIVAVPAGVHSTAGRRLGSPRKPRRIRRPRDTHRAGSADDRVARDGCPLRTSSPGPTGQPVEGRTKPLV